MKLYVIILVLCFFSVGIYAQKKSKSANRDAKTLAYSGSILFESGMYYESILHLKESIKLDPSYPFSYYMLAKNQYMLDDLDGSLESINKALLLDSSSVEFFWLKGAIYNYMQEFESASLSLEYAHQLRPKNVKYLNSLIENSFENGNYKKGLNYCDLLLEIDSLHVNAMSRKAIVLILQEQSKERSKEAFELLKKAYQLDPNDRVTLTTLVEYYWWIDDFKNFEIHSQRLAEEFPDLEENYLFRAMQFLLEKDFQNALDNFKIYNERQPRIVKIYGYIAYCYRMMDLTHKAIDVLRAGLVLEPDSKILLLELTIAYFFVEDKENAEKYILGALTVDSMDVQSLLLASEIYEEFEDDEKAVFYIKKALEIDQDNLNALFDIAHYMLYEDDFEKALSYFERYNSIEPNNKYIIFKMGTCYAKLDNPEKACEYYQKSLDLGYERASSFVDKFCYGK